MSSCGGVIIVAAGLFGAGLLKGITGIGYSTCALPFLVAAVGIERSLTLVLAPAIVTNLALLTSIAGLGSALNRFWRFYVSIIPGIVLGAGLLGVADPKLSVGILGMLTIAYCCLAVSKFDLQLGSKQEQRLAGPVGFANGIIAGFTGSQTIPLLPYMMSLRLSPDEQVQAINVSVTIASTALAIALMANGLFHWEILGWSVLACIPAILGVLVGGWARVRLPWREFRIVSLGALAALGVALLFQAGQPTAAPDCNRSTRESCRTDR